MSRPVKTHKFRGKQYTIKEVSSLPRAKDGKEVEGDCDSPNTPGKEIRVLKGLSPLRELDVFLHEGLHACNWDLDESCVSETAHDLAYLLWRLGYRRVNVQPETA